MAEEKDAEQEKKSEENSDESQNNDSVKSEDSGDVNASASPENQEEGEEGSDSSETEEKPQKKKKKKKKTKKKTSKKKKKKKKSTPLHLQLLLLFFKFKRLVQEMFSAFKTKDFRTRLGTVGFFSLLSLCLVLSLLLIGRFLKGDSSEEADLLMEQELARIESKAESQDSQELETTASVNIGRFLIQLSLRKDEKPAYGAVNMVEVEIVLECSSEEVCAQIEHRIITVRDQVTKSFEGFSKQEILSMNGKNRLKAKVLRRVNQWLEEGEVTDVFLVKLLIG